MSVTKDKGDRGPFSEYAATPGTLVGKFFHAIEEGVLTRQGYVIDRVGKNYFLIGFYDWALGQESSEARLVHIWDMSGWFFYASDEQMRYSYDYGSASRYRSALERRIKKEKG